MTGFKSKRAAAQAMDKIDWADHEPDGLVQPEHDAATALREALEQPAPVPDTDLAYTVALQRAIEWHCKSKVVPPDIAGKCPHHAEKLNKALALAQPQQEPVAMRMPKVGDRVVCIEDESLATVQSLTAGGSPDIKFDDGSHGTYLLREFAELFRYASTQQRPWVGLTDEEIENIFNNWPTYHLDHEEFARAVEAKLRSKNEDRN